MANTPPPVVLLMSVFVWAVDSSLRVQVEVDTQQEDVIPEAEHTDTGNHAIHLGITLCFYHSLSLIKVFKLLGGGPSSRVQSSSRECSYSPASSRSSSTTFIFLRKCCQSPVSSSLLAPSVASSLTRCSSITQQRNGSKSFQNSRLACSSISYSPR